MEGEENFSGIKVDEILAHFFVRKFDTKVRESEDSSISSKHSSGCNRKENGKDLKKNKKKHKSKEKKSKRKSSSKRASRSPKRHHSRSQSSDTHESDHSKSSKYSPRHGSPTSRSSSSRRLKHSNKHKSRSPKHGKHRSKSPRHSREYRSRSSSHSDRSKNRSPRHKSRSPGRSKHRSRSPRHSRICRSNSSHSDRSPRRRSPERSKCKSRSPRHSRRYGSRSSSYSDRSKNRSSRYKSRSPGHSKHRNRSPRHSRKYRSRSGSRSDRSPRRKRRDSGHISDYEDKGSPQNNHSSVSGDVAKCKKDEINQATVEKHSLLKICVPEEAQKSVVPLNHISNDSSKAEYIPVISICDKKGSNIALDLAVLDSCSSLKDTHCVFQNVTELKSHNHRSCSVEDTRVTTADTQNCIAHKAVTLPANVDLPEGKKNIAYINEMKKDGVSHSGEMQLLKVSCDGSELNKMVSNDSNFGQGVTDNCEVLVNKAQICNTVTVSAPITVSSDAVESSDSKGNLESSAQMKTKIVFQDLKSSSFVKTLYSCDDIELPKDLPHCKSSQSSDSAPVTVNENNLSEKERVQESSAVEKKCKIASESTEKSSDSDWNGSLREKKRKRSKDKKHKRSKEKKHKKKKKSLSKERSISPKKSDGREKFDKAKLLSVARRNVLTMLEKGTLPQGINVENLRHEQLISIKAGGKSVRELTEFCQALSKREGEVDDDTGDKVVAKNDDDSDQPFIHHPFKLREQSLITVNIKNATQLPVRTHAEKVAENARLSLQFPVSSGSQHRQKEMEWVPVEKDDKVTASTSEKKVTSKTTVKEGKKTVEGAVATNAKLVTQPTIPTSVDEAPNIIIPLPPQPSTPAPPPPPPPAPPPPPPVRSCVAPSSLVPTTYPVPAPFLPSETSLAINLPSAPTSSSTGHMFQASTVQELSSPYGMPSGFVPVVPASAPVMNAFPPLSAKNIDLSSVVADRLKAVRKLQENPNDPEGLSLLHLSEQKLQIWVQSQQVPGKFTGSTDAKLLSAYELSGPNPVWTRKDSLIRAAPVTEGKGMSLMKKMGWNPGEGLGKNKEGTLEPLVLDIKMDKKGLVSVGEEQRKKPTIAFCHKHPVSVLAELCAKRKWSPPMYTCISETGPSHRRHFIFKVDVNNIEYQPATASPNKKLAKAQAAVLCLNAAGVAASEYIMPQ